jgi:hypothetical protein
VKKTVIEDNTSDTFRLKPLNESFYQNLTGTVIDNTNEGHPVKNAKIFVMGDSSVVYSNEIGYFSISFRKIRGEQLRIRAIKEGYKPFDEYISENESSLVIPLTK